MFLAFPPRRHYALGPHHHHPWARHMGRAPCAQSPLNGFEFETLEELLGPQMIDHSLRFITNLAEAVAAAEKNENKPSTSTACASGSCLKKRKDVDTECSRGECPKKSRFEVKMNVDGYKANELDVKLVENYLVVKGSHESEDGEGNFVSRQFTRKFQIPEDVQMEEMNCNLNSKDNTMLISAPWKIPALEENKDKVIPINVTPIASGGDNIPLAAGLSSSGSESAVTTSESSLNVDSKKATDPIPDKLAEKDIVVGE